MKFKPFSRVITVLLLTLFHTYAIAKDNSFLEFGIGVEYGGIGTQFHFPIGGKVFDVYGSAGIFGYSNQTDEQVGGGIGVNFYLDNRSSVNLYSGVLNVNKYLTENLEHKVDVDYGLSVGYKYHFHKIKESGWSLGLSYNAYKDDHYPFFSIGYRY